MSITHSVLAQTSWSINESCFEINYKNTYFTSDNSHTYGNPCYPPGLTPHIHQSQDLPSHAHNTHTNSHSSIVIPAVNPRVASVSALKLHPSIIQLNHSAQVSPKTHQPRASQKHNDGCCCPELSQSTLTAAAAPTSTTTPTSTQTPASTTTRAIHAKGTTVPPALHELFMCLHNEFDKGEKAARKGVHKYPWFTQTQKYNSLLSASGVAMEEGLKLALIRWHTMLKAEEDSYKIDNQPINTVDNFMIKWQIEANSMAATYEGNFVLIGQMVRATPRTLKWVKHNKLCNPKKHVGAQLQAFVTGTEAGLLNMSKLKVNERARCQESLSNLINLKTKGTTNKWLWKGCEEKLTIEGHYACNVLADLKHNRILILETEVGPTQKAKGKRSHHDKPPATSLTDHKPPEEGIPIANFTPCTDHSTTNHTPAQGSSFNHLPMFDCSALNRVQPS
ncbi:hypothetical protein DFH28DRAFT_1085194 [Melampsora americana]|nr:hypothetical protein DFH28DRAFT_1085194 [Melampsora americana]